MILRLGCAVPVMAKPQAGMRSGIRQWYAGNWQCSAWPAGRAGHRAGAALSWGAATELECIHSPILMDMYGYAVLPSAAAAPRRTRIDSLRVRLPRPPMWPPAALIPG